MADSCSPKKSTMQEYNAMPCRGPFDRFEQKGVFMFKTTFLSKNNPLECAEQKRKGCITYVCLILIIVWSTFENVALVFLGDSKILIIIVLN